MEHFIYLNSSSWSIECADLIKKNHQNSQKHVLETICEQIPGGFDGENGEQVTL